MSKRLIIIYDVYFSSSSAYVTTIPVSIACSEDGSALIASIPKITGFTIRSGDGEPSMTSVMVEASVSSTAQFILKCILSS